MHLQLFRSLWTNGCNLDAALADCRAGTFDGVEGPVPSEVRARREFAAKLRAAGAPFVAEIASGGGYVPKHASPAQHLDDFRRQAEAALECAPLFLTVLAGCDAWPAAQSVEFFGRAVGVAGEFGVVASFETHRSRPIFNPWAARDLLGQLPGLRLTCDFSHWCCVCERLVLDGEPEILALCAERAHHVHARVGYDQGPQAPHPDAPEYHGALGAHERWWDAIWSAHQRAGRGFTTMTPEFGPDGYLHTLPFSAAPVANLDEINHWMAARQRERFAGAFGANVSSGSRL
jgi:sugar phosphate isomerase/epimerase